MLLPLLLVLQQPLLLLQQVLLRPVAVALHLAVTAANGVASVAAVGCRGSG